MKLSLGWNFFTSIPALGFKYHVDIDKMASPRAFKSHFPYDLMPCGSPSDTPGKYIYVVRNPRDVAVSYFHHDRAIPFYPLYEWSDYFEMFMRGDLDRLETILTMSSVGGLTKMTTMCFFSSTRT